MSVSPANGNGPTQGQRKTLTRVGIEPTKKNNGMIKKSEEKGLIFHFILRLFDSWYLEIEEKRPAVLPYETQEKKLGGMPAEEAGSTDQLNRSIYPCRVDMPQ